MEYELLNLYIDYLENTLGRSANTVTSYKKDLIEFHNFIADMYKLNDITNDFYSKITLIDIHKFTSYLSNKGNSNATRHRKGIALKEFFRYLRETKVMAENITENLKLPKVEKSIPIYLSEDESKQLIKTVMLQHHKFVDRDIAIILFLMVLGLRSSELCEIKLNDIHDNVLKITKAKGNKQRELEMPSAVIKVYNKYLEFRENGFCRIVFLDHLFLSKSGKKMTNTALNNMIKKYLELAGIQREKFSAHKMRHTSATLMLKSGVNLKDIQEFLGHENIQTTQLYTHTSSADVGKAINKNPLANMF